MLSHLLLAFLLQTQASNASLGYQFTVPEGFSAFPEGAAGNPDIVECWAEDEPVSQQGGLVLCVQRLRGVIGREPIRPDEMPVGAQLTTMKWHDFELYGVRAQVERDEGPSFTLVAQVPLKPEAVQLLLAGPADQVERGDTLLKTTLASLHGESNWLTHAERMERIGQTVGIWITIAFAVGTFFYMRKRRAKAA
ncbi:MAG TPA: hypothetical protein VFN39_06305 [Gemmatimonadaceae bacterium]|nr:hypothetical protein [Gemmatimonadaceae bacterium]